MVNLFLANLTFQTSSCAIIFAKEIYASLKIVDQRAFSLTNQLQTDQFLTAFYPLKVLGQIYKDEPSTIRVSSYIFSQFRKSGSLTSFSTKGTALHGRCIKGFQMSVLTRLATTSSLNLAVVVVADGLY